MQEVTWELGSAWKRVEEIRKSGLPLIGLISELAVDTSRPIYQSQVIGAALPLNGYLAAYHVTDNPEGAIRYLQLGGDLVALNPYGDLGGGFYVSSVPEYWRSRSKRKWEPVKMGDSVNLRYSVTTGTIDYYELQFLRGE